MKAFEEETRKGASEMEGLIGVKGRPIAAFGDFRSGRSPGPGYPDNAEEPPGDRTFPTFCSC